jgi:hypothetical protein
LKAEVVRTLGVENGVGRYSAPASLPCMKTLSHVLHHFSEHHLWDWTHSSNLIIHTCLIGFSLFSVSFSSLPCLPQKIAFVQVIISGSSLRNPS